MPWNAADLALASLRVLGQAPRRSQPGAQGSLPCRSPPRSTASPSGRWERVQEEKETLSPKLVSGGSLGRPLLLIPSETKLTGGVYRDSRQAPGSQVLTERFQPVLEPGGAQRCAKPVLFVPSCSCAGLCARER